MSKELATRGSELPALPAEMTIEELVARSRKIHDAMKAVMKDGEHYGTIPGTPKPTLLKPGGEKLMGLFMLDPQYSTVETREGDHLTVVSTCTLYHIGTGARVGSGMGSCSTRETKYAYRESQRKCPHCSAEAIIKGKAEYGGGWLCFKKRKGCGAKFKDDDEAIVKQSTGRVPNPDLPDTWNTVVKMANKRSMIAAVLNVTAASDLFTQDMEDMPHVTRPPVESDEPDEDERKQERANEAHNRKIEEEEKPAPPKTITGPQAKKMFELADKSGWNMPQLKSMLAAFGWAASADIPVNMLDEVLAIIKKGPGAAGA